MNSEEGIRFRVLRALATMVYRLAWPIVILCMLLAAASVHLTLNGSAYLGINRLTFTGNPNDLLRSDASYHKRYLEYTREFRAEEDYAIVVCGPDFERNRQCVESIAEKLRLQPSLFKKIFYRIDVTELADRGLLFLELDQLKQMEQSISEFGSMLKQEDFKLDLNSLLSAANRMLDPKYMSQTKNQQSLDAFTEEFVGSLNALADRLEGKATGKPVRFGNFIAEKAKLGDMEKQRTLHEYIAFENGTILIIQVPSPNKEASFGEHDYAIKPLKAIIGEARNQFPGLEIGLTGEPALSEDEAQASGRDTTIASIVTFLMIALLFWFSYHEFSRPALALLTLMVAICWTLGFTTLGIGHLNILSITFIPMILGLGIDFGIQILGRYEEELPKAQNVITALTHTIMHTGNAIITGASTTAAAFYTMCLNDFVGLSEMGLISGTGIIFCVVVNLFFLPALLTLYDRRRSGPREVPQSQHYEKSRLFDRLVLDHAGIIIVLAIAVTITALFQIPLLRFDYNLLNLQNNHLESVRFERKLIDNKDSFSVISAAVLSDNLKEAEEKAEKIKKLRSVREVISLTELVPHDQEEKLKIITNFKRILENIRLPKSGVNVNVPENVRVLQELKASCEKLAQRAKKWAPKEQKKEADEFFGRLIPPMNRALNVLKSMDQVKAEQILSAYQTQVFGELRKNLDQLKRQKVDRPITENDVPQVLRERYRGRTGKILLEVYPRENIWDREPLDRFVRELRSVDETVTGTPVQNFEYIELLRISYEKAAIYALIAIILLVTLHFRTLKYVIPTLLPLMLGIVWTVGLMPLIDLSFNPANIITLPLVIGIGVAFGVYAVDRYRENRSPAIFSTSTGKAILLSALTTIFGFGSLALASHQGIASLGLLMTMGVSMCLVAALYVCPSVLRVLGRRRSEMK